ncbi:MAG: hypothetical protein GW802_03795 [Armatimonadetes bacterium]|nr:hypothetical protein [Armatimonadota bacterium]
MFARCFALAVFAVSNSLAGAPNVPASGPAAASLQTGLDRDRIEMGLRYQGDQLFLFGHVPQETTDLVAVLQSRHNPPPKLLRKGRVMGLWFGVKQFEVEGLPDLYMVNLTCPICNGMETCRHAGRAEELFRRLAPYGGAGYGSLRRHSKVERLRGAASEDDEDTLFKGIWRLKEKSGLYAIRTNAIHLEASDMFFHSFPIPDGAQEGQYSVRTYVLGAAGLLGMKEDSASFRKVGAVAQLTRMAQRHALWYGILTVVVALGAGLLAGALFKKGGGH